MVGKRGNAANEWRLWSTRNEYASKAAKEWTQGGRYEEGGDHSTSSVKQVDLKRAKIGTVFRDQNCISQAF